MQKTIYAAHIDESYVWTDRDDRALDGLPLLDAFRLERRLEHRGEVFGVAHGMLLVEGPRVKNRLTPDRDQLA